MSSKLRDARAALDGASADTPVGTLLSVNIGKPKDVPWQGNTVFTGVFEEAVFGPRRVRKLSVDGDGQGDLAGHGGEQRAVFLYQIESYRYWERELGRNDFVYGQFGENFTVEGLADASVSATATGSARRSSRSLSPRVTCYRVGIRMNDPRIPSESQRPVLTGSGDASPQTQWLIDEEVQRIVDKAHVQVTRLLTEHREQLDNLSHALLAAETLAAPAAYAAANISMRKAEVEDSPERVPDTVAG